MIVARLPSKHTLTVSEAAEFAGCSPDSIRRYCASDGIGWRPGGRGHWRVNAVALVAYLANDHQALAAIQAGQFDDPSVVKYRRAPRVEKFAEPL